MIGYVPIAPVKPAPEWQALAEEDEVIAIALWLIEVQQSTLVGLPLRRLTGSYTVRVPKMNGEPTTDCVTPGHGKFFDDPVVEHLLLAHGIIDASSCARKTHHVDHKLPEYRKLHVVRHYHEVPLLG